MTTSLTSPPAGSQTLASSPAAMEADPSRTGSQRYPRWLLASALSLCVIAAASWAIVSWSNSRQDVASINEFIVQPRTFSVVLKEKGELKAAKSTEIVSEVEGRSTIITLIPEGTAVKKGDLLVELASDQIDDRIRQEELKESNATTAYEAAKTELEIQRDQNASDIRKANLQIELRNLALEKYEKGDWTQKLEDADVAIQEARMNLERAQENFQAAEKLFHQNYMTKTDYKDDEFRHYKAKWELAKAKMAKEVLEKYTHVGDLRQKESDLEEAGKEFDRVKKKAEAEELKRIRTVEGKKKELDLTREQLAKLRGQKEKCRITAPTQGIVVYYSGGGRHFMSSDSQIREGATVHERQIILTLPDTSKMLVLVRVHETKTDKLHLQQPVKVHVEGLPGHELTGTVTKIAAVADTQNRWLNPDLKEYETEITLDPTDAPLKPGVTAHCEILVERVKNKLAVPVQSVYTKNGSRFVFRTEKGHVTAQQVQLGAIGTEWAQVKDGLTGHEQILLAFSDEQKRLIPELPLGQQPDRGSKRWSRSQGHTAARTSQGITVNKGASRQYGSKGPDQRRAAAPQHNPASSKARPDAWLTRMDANGDGKIQENELPAPMRSMFSKIDKNRDGVVDAGELKALSRRRRQHSAQQTGTSHSPAGDSKRTGP